MRYFLLSIFIFISAFSYAQNIQHFGIAATYGNGTVLPTNPFVKGENSFNTPVENYQFYSLKALWQNPGYTDWQKTFKGPYYGFGLSLGQFDNVEEIGYPISYYGILGVPILRWKRLAAFTEFQFGITTNWRHYDEETNPYNIVIGGIFTVHLDIGAKVYYQLSPRWDVGAGMSFVHFSNGGFERPNRGFNIYAPSVELKYRFKGRPDYENIQKPSEKERPHGMYIMLGYGDHQLNEHELDTNYFAIAGISSIYFKQFSNGFRLGAGADFNYWMGLTANPDGTMGHRNFDNLTIGLILQPEMVIDRLTLVGGIGIYARHLHYGAYNQTYQRLGARFDLYDNFSIGVNVRAVNFMLAEFLEFNMGYQFKY